MAALLVEDDEGPKWLLANLGDSRIYRFAAGVLEQVSVDHSLVQELIDAGTITEEDAAVHPERNVITRALGNAEGVEADYFLLPLPSVERLVLCTDGVTGMIDDQTLAALLMANEDPRDAADELVKAALAAGGEDNATAVVVDVVGTDDRRCVRRRAPATEPRGEAGSPPVTRRARPQLVVPPRRRGSAIFGTTPPSCCPRPRRVASPGSGSCSTTAPASTRPSTR